MHLFNPSQKPFSNEIIHLKPVCLSHVPQFFQLFPGPPLPYRVNTRHSGSEGRTFCRDNACVSNLSQGPPAALLTQLIQRHLSHGNLQPSCEHSFCPRLRHTVRLLGPSQQPMEDKKEYSSLHLLTLTTCDDRMQYFMGSEGPYFF